MIKANRVENQKTINLKNLEKGLINFQQQSLSSIITTRGKARLKDAQT